MGKNYYGIYSIPKNVQKKGGCAMLKKKYLTPKMGFYLTDLDVAMQDVIGTSGSVDIYDIWG